ADPANGAVDSPGSGDLAPLSPLAGIIVAGDTSFFLVRGPLAEFVFEVLVCSFSSKTGARCERFAFAGFFSSALSRALFFECFAKTFCLCGIAGFPVWLSPDFNCRFRQFKCRGRWQTKAGKVRGVVQ